MCGTRDVLSQLEKNKKGSNEVAAKKNEEEKVDLEKALKDFEDAQPTPRGEVREPIGALPGIQPFPTGTGPWVGNSMSSPAKR